MIRNSIIPSYLTNCLSQKTIISNNKLLPIVSDQSIFILALLTTMGYIKDVIGNTNARLQMLEPITFPIDMSGEPVKAEYELISNSGAEVPNATMVSPTTKDEILKL